LAILSNIRLALDLEVIGLSVIIGYKFNSTGAKKIIGIEKKIELG